MVAQASVRPSVVAYLLLVACRPCVVVYVQELIAARVLVPRYCPVGIVSKSCRARARARAKATAKATAKD